jgi:hypothetical protein
MRFGGTMYAPKSTITRSGNALLQGFNAQVIAADMNDSDNGSVRTDIDVALLLMLQR